MSTAKDVEIVEISEADMMAAICNGGGGVFHTQMAHEDWCKTMKTGNGSDCTCEPEVTHYREKM